MKFELKKEQLRSILKDGILEGIVAFISVVTIIWGLTQTAILLNGLPDPIKFTKGKSEIELTPFMASISGSLQLSPTILEGQKSEFGYWYGRELLKERKSRVVQNWTDTEATMSWEIQFSQKGVYEVMANCKPALGSEVLFSLKNQKIERVFEKDSTLGEYIVGDIVIDEIQKMQSRFKVKNGEEFQFNKILIRQKKGN